MESLKDKMNKAYGLACDLAYGEITHAGNYFTVRDDKRVQSDRIWGYVDGLWSEYLWKHMEGRCSLQATIDFDIGKFEEQVDKDIAFFEGLLNEIGKPKQLTKQDLRDRGYVVKD